jgi:peptidoglycan hydrolase-like protein with peptidoglycan-binding domain
MALTFFDSAWPLATPLPVDGVAFYIGGNTPHVWTKAEIEAQPARYRLPVFVRSDPSNASATADVAAAVTYLHQLGAPAGCLVAWDLETADDPGYISAVYRNLAGAGYKLIVYASQSVITQEGNPDGLYWGADWTGSPHLHAPDVMTQYVSFASYDESEAQGNLPFWDTHHASPKPAPSPTLAWQEALMKALPTLMTGATGDYVKTVQGLCCARGYVIPIDGDFGTETESAVMSVQINAHLVKDGVVGPATWPVLIAGAK